MASASADDLSPQNQRWEFRRKGLEAAATVLLVAALAAFSWYAAEILLLLFAGILARLFLGGLAGFVSSRR